MTELLMAFGTDPSGLIVLAVPWLRARWWVWVAAIILGHVPCFVYWAVWLLLRRPSVEESVLLVGRPNDPLLAVLAGVRGR